MVKKVAKKRMPTLAKLAITSSKRGKRKAEDSDDELPVIKKAKMPDYGAGSNKQPDLSKFKGLPLVLLREVFQYLSPDDLVNLCDAALIFWHALCRKSEAYIWKTCRENEGIYEIPDNMNEYYWAKLLFSNRCMECDAGNVKLADFYLRRRICSECRSTKCLRGESHDGLSEEAFNCSPVTPFPTEGSRYAMGYWKADVVEQHQKLTALRLNVELGRPGATRALEEYKASRRKLLRIIRAEVEDFTMYQEIYLTKKKEEKEDLFQPRYEEVEGRFLELGYLRKDFPPNMKMHKLVRSKTKLTERAWHKILEALEPEIQAIRDFRERQEWALLKVSRRKTLDKAYATYKFENVPHTLWKYLPQVHALCMFPAFNELITCDKARKLEAGDFALPLAQLDTILISAYDETQSRLRKLMVEDADPLHLKLSSTALFQDLQLATVVFRCKRCSEFIFGFEHVRVHTCARTDHALKADFDEGRDGYTDPKPFSKKFPFDCTVPEGAAQVVRMIVEVLGLDPRTTTAAQMDQNTTRLRCACTLGRTFSVRAYKWSDLVQHIFSSHQTEIEAGTLKKPVIVPQLCMPEIRAKEAVAKQKDIEDSFRRYACTHCDKYGRAEVMHTYNATIRHIQEEHGIPDPCVDVDLIDLTGRRVSGHYYHSVGVEYNATPE